MLRRDDDDMKSGKNGKHFSDRNKKVKPCLSAHSHTHGQTSYSLISFERFLPFIPPRIIILHIKS